MKKLLSIVAIAALAFSAVGCADFLEQFQNTIEEQEDKDKDKEKENEKENEKEPEKDPAKVTVQLVAGESNFAVADILVSLSDANATFTVEGKTNAEGAASFTLKAGTYVASATYTTSENGTRIAYSGANNEIVVKDEDTEVSAVISLQKVESKQIIIKELYFGGCTNPETSKGYTNDAYVILYNNSDIEADASNVVFGFLAPYNGNGTNKYYNAEGKLLYEDLDWIPSYGALWWFTSEVKIPAWSQIVVAIFGAIDHTATVSTSVNLANEAYYWMSNSDVAAYTNNKYAVSEVIPAEHYLSCSPFTQGNAWAMSNSSPAFFIGNMPKDQALALSQDTENYDQTLGEGKPAFYVVKFPKANVIGAIEVYSQANIEKSNPRFPADINTGYVAITNNQGYTVYHNVDKQATEALPENEGKLVYDYAGGTYDEAAATGSTDPSGIDAEASLAAGAHIIYVQTNNTGNDYHQRKVASIKEEVE